jgi:hypothetical protein
MPPLSFPDVSFAFLARPEVYSMGFDEAHVRRALAQAGGDEHFFADQLTC